MLIRTHRDNWSPLTSIGGAIVYRDRLKDVAVNLDSRKAVAELLAASASKSIEVDESAREELEAHGLTVTATGAVVELKTIAPRDLEPGEQLAAGDLPPGSTSAPIAEPGPDGEDDDQDDEDDDQDGDQVADPDRPAHEDPPRAAAAATLTAAERKAAKAKAKADRKAAAKAATRGGRA